MASNITLNPFDLVYNKLVDLVRKSPAVEIAVPRVQDNVVSVNQDALLASWADKDSEKSQRQILLYHSTIGGNLNFASNATQVLRSYRFLIRSERAPVFESISPIEFAILCVLVDSNYDNELRALDWHGQKFVKNIALTSFTSGDMDTERTGIVGWASIAEIQVLMMLPQTMLRQYARGEVIIKPESF